MLHNARLIELRVKKYYHNVSTSSSGKHYFLEKGAQKYPWSSLLVFKVMGYTGDEPESGTPATRENRTMNKVTIMVARTPYVCEKKRVGKHTNVTPAKN